MLFFLYLSGIISFLIIIISFKLEGRKLKKKNFSTNKMNQYLLERLFIKLIIIAFISIFIIFAIPSIIWNFSEKEITYEDKVDKTELLYPFPEDDTTYAGLSKNKYEVVVSSVEDKSSFDKSKTKIVTINLNEQPKYEKIGHYKKVRIKNDGLILNSANNMFCSIIVDSDDNKENSSKSLFNFQKGWKEDLVEYDIVLYIPKGSVKEQ